MIDNIIDINKMFSLTDKDLEVIHSKCIEHAKLLNKDLEEINIENIRYIVESVDNKRTYLLNKYPRDYSYMDFIIDSLKDNIKYL